MARFLVLAVLACVVLAHGRYATSKLRIDWCTTTTYCPDGYHCCPDLLTCCPTGTVCSGGRCYRTENDIQGSSPNNAISGGYRINVNAETTPTTTPEPVRFEVIFNMNE